jgi:hypothetical protein
VGETKLHVKIQGFSWNFVFLVVKNLACDLILGSDFMTKTGLVLNLQKGEFYFQFDPKSVFRMAKPQRTNFRLQSLIQEPKEKQQGIVLDHLTTNQSERLRVVVNKYPDVLTPKLGLTHLIQYDIR